MRSRVRPLLIAVCLLLMASALAGCNSNPFVDNIPGQTGNVSFVGYSSETILKIHVAQARTYAGVSALTVYWEDGTEALTREWWKGGASCFDKKDYGLNCTNLLCKSGFDGDVEVPARPEGGELYVMVEAGIPCYEDGGFEGPRWNNRYDHVRGWTNTVSIPAYAAPPSPPTVTLFAHATPVGFLGTLIDARLSTGTGTLSYEWSPAACAGTTYPLGFGHDGESAPTGTARYSGTEPTTCTVVVRGANGNSSSKTLEMPAINRGLHNNGGLSFVGGSVVVTAIGADSPSRACLDLDNTGVFSLPVELE